MEWKPWMDKLRLRIAARLILKASQGAPHCQTVQKAGKEIAAEVANLTRWVEA